MNGSRCDGYRRLAGAGFAVIMTFAVMVGTLAARPVWMFTETEIPGSQIDALPGPGSKIHVMSNRYQVLNASGQIESYDTRFRDGGQTAMVFPPAIAIGPTGTVHVVSREGGSYSDNRIHYFKLPVGGALVQYSFGTRVERNYVVGVAASDAAGAFMHHTESFGNVWGDVHVWRDGGSAGTKLGSLSGIWRSDTDARMRGHNGKLFLVSGLCDPAGKVSFSWASAAGDVFAQLLANMKTHTGGGAGGTRRGFPDLYIDLTGAVHLTYGCQIGQVLYNRYSPTQSKVFSSDKVIISGLGDWHVSLGLSAVAASDDGAVIVVVGVQQFELTEELVWVYSTDAGATWSSKSALGKFVSTGEGRRRPRLVALGDTFYLLYHDVTTNVITLGTLAFSVATQRPNRDAQSSRCRDMRVSGSNDVIVTLARSERVRLRVMDISGRELARTDHGVLASGNHVLNWWSAANTGSRLAGGVYRVVLDAGDESYRAAGVVVR